MIVPSKLQPRALLPRTADPADSRARQLRLTAIGRELVARVLRYVEAADQGYFAAAGKHHDAFGDALGALSRHQAPRPDPVADRPAGHRRRTAAQKTPYSRSGGRTLPMYKPLWQSGR
jgi:hypothetical protein